LAKTRETNKKNCLKKIITSEKKSPEKITEPNEVGKKRETMTTDEVAKFLGVTTARVSQLKKDGVIAPLPSRSRKEADFYKPLETCIRLIRHYRELSDSRGSRETEEMKNAKERQMIARARKEELELLEVEGGLAKIEDMKRILGMVLTRLRINLLAIPKGVAPQIREMKDTNVIAEKIYERICRALQETVNLDLDKLLAENEN